MNQSKLKDEILYSIATGTMTTNDAIDLVWLAGYEAGRDSIRGSHNQPVAQFNTQRTLVAIHPTIKDACISAGCKRMCIQRAAKDGHRTRKGYYWEYVK